MARLWRKSIRTLVGSQKTHTLPKNPSNSSPLPNQLLESSPTTPLYIASDLPPSPLLSTVSNLYPSGFPSSSHTTSRITSLTHWLKFGFGSVLLNSDTHCIYGHILPSAGCWCGCSLDHLPPSTYSSPLLTWKTHSPHPSHLTFRLLGSIQGQQTHRSHTFARSPCPLSQLSAGGSSPRPDRPRWINF